jgi:hypothetical protein
MNFPPPNVDPPPLLRSTGVHEDRVADRWAKEQFRHRLGIAGQVCAYVSLGIFAGPWIVFSLLGWDLSIAFTLSAIGAFVGLPLSVVGIVLSILGLRSLFDKKTAVYGLIFCSLTFVLILGFVLVTLLLPK